MKQENVKIGDKVVPFRKTDCIYSYQEWLCTPDGEEFKKTGYTQVKFIQYDMTFALGLSGYSFNASDFEPYKEKEPAKEPYTSRAIYHLINCVIDKRLHDFRDSVKNDVLAEMVNKTAPQEDKPLTFEVGETVKVNSVDPVGKKYTGTTHTISAISENHVQLSDIPFLSFHVCVLEKVPQPVALEVFISGVKYVREELK
jgi:hypothetical protein